MDQQWIVRWADDQSLLGPWRPGATHLSFLVPAVLGGQCEFKVPSDATIFTLAGPATERTSARLPAGIALTYCGEHRPSTNARASHLFQVREGDLAGGFIFMESGIDRPRPLHPPVSDCPHQIPLLSADAGQRNVWLHEPAHAEFWEVTTKLTAYDDWKRRFPVQIAVGTRLRLRQADGLWIGIEFDNPGWYHLEVLDGPLRGGCVVVNAAWPRYELPAELREAAGG